MSGDLVYLNGLYLPGSYLLKNKYSPNGVKNFFFLSMASGVKEDSCQDLRSNFSACFPILLGIWADAKLFYEEKGGSASSFIFWYLIRSDQFWLGLVVQHSSFLLKFVLECWRVSHWGPHSRRFSKTCVNLGVFG